MVGIVIVSHSQNLAQGVVEIAKLMAPEVLIEAAGGLDDGSFGTSFDKIKNAILKVNSKDGVIVLMDMGSALMTTEMVLEDLNDDNIKMVDCPVAEGGVLADVAPTILNLMKIPVPAEMQGRNLITLSA